jgi:hypothetical protein
MLWLALLPGTLVAVLADAVFLVHSIDNIEQGLRTRGKAISRHLAGFAEFGIFSGQRAALGALSSRRWASTRMFAARRLSAREVKSSPVAGDSIRRVGHVLARVEGHRVDGRRALFIEPVLQHRLPVDDIYGGGLASGPRPRLLGYVVLELSLREVCGRITRLVWIAIRDRRPGCGAGRLAGLAHCARGDPSAAGRQRGGRAHRWRRSRGPDDGETAGPLRSLAIGINDMAARIGLSQEELRARVAEATAGLQREKDAAERATRPSRISSPPPATTCASRLHALGLFRFGAGAFGCRKARTGAGRRISVPRPIPCRTCSMRFSTFAARQWKRRAPHSPVPLGPVLERAARPGPGCRAQGPACGFARPTLGR